MFNYFASIAVKARKNFKKEQLAIVDEFEGRLTTGNTVLQATIYLNVLLTPLQPQTMSD